MIQEQFISMKDYVDIMIAKDRIKELDKKITILKKNAATQIKKPEQCSICNSKEKIVYDHNHKTNQFRGYICQKCNLMLGFARDNIDILAKGANYLKKTIES